MNEEKLKKGYNGYLLTDKGRSDLLTHIEPIFPDVIAHHVTYEFGIYDQLPPDATYVRAVAQASNDKVQAVVVMVNGAMIRPDGGIYHITLSLDKAAGAKAVDSNVLIKESDWDTIDPFNIKVEPKFFPF